MRNEHRSDIPLSPQLPSRRRPPCSYPQNIFALIFFPPSLLPPNGVLVAGVRLEALASLKRGDGAEAQPKDSGAGDHAGGDEASMAVRAVIAAGARGDADRPERGGGRKDTKRFGEPQANYGGE